MSGAKATLRGVAGGFSTLRGWAAVVATGRATVAGTVAVVAVVGTVVVLGRAESAGVVIGALLIKMWSNDVSIVASLSVRGASGELAEGLRNARRMSLAAVMMRSAEEAVGMVIWVGNHVMVSQTRSRRVVRQTRTDYLS